jgi:hypothetical protein
MESGRKTRPGSAATVPSPRSTTTRKARHYDPDGISKVGCLYQYLSKSCHFAVISVLA